MAFQQSHNRSFPSRLQPRGRCLAPAFTPAPKPFAVPAAYQRRWPAGSPRAAPLPPRLPSLCSSGESSQGRLPGTAAPRLASPGSLSPAPPDGETRLAQTHLPACLLACLLPVSLYPEPAPSLPSSRSVAEATRRRSPPSLTGRGARLRWPRAANQRPHVPRGEQARAPAEAGPRGRGGGGGSGGGGVALGGCRVLPIAAAASQSGRSRAPASMMCWCCYQASRGKNKTNKQKNSLEALHLRISPKHCSAPCCMEQLGCTQPGTACGYRGPLVIPCEVLPTAFRWGFLSC